MDVNKYVTIIFLLPSQENRASVHTLTSHQQDEIFEKIESGISQRDVAQVIGCSCDVLSLSALADNISYSLIVLINTVALMFVYSILISHVVKNNTRTRPVLVQYIPRLGRQERGLYHRSDYVKHHRR